MSTNKEFNIIGGPNREAIFDLLRLGNGQVDIGWRSSFSFLLENKLARYPLNEIQVRIVSLNSLRHVDASGQNFLLDGVVELPPELVGSVGYTKRRFERAEYDTSNRRGHLTLK